MPACEQEGLNEVCDEDWARHYHLLLGRGFSESNAARLATGRYIGIGLKTGTTFLAGRDDGFGGDNRGRKVAYAKARAAGVNPTGKVFMKQLTRSGVPFDPQAWVSDETDVRRRCRQLGVGCEGSINVKTPQYIEPQKKPHLADDIVAAECERIIDERGADLTAAERKNLPGEVRQRLSPSDAQIEG